MSLINTPYTVTRSGNSLAVSFQSDVYDPQYIPCADLRIKPHESNPNYFWIDGREEDGVLLDWSQNTNLAGSDRATKESNIAALANGIAIDYSPDSLTLASDLNVPEINTNSVEVTSDITAESVTVGTQVVINALSVVTDEVLYVNGKTIMDNGLVVRKANDDTPYLLCEEPDSDDRFAVEKIGANGLAMQLYSNDGLYPSVRIRNGNASWLNGSLMLGYEGSDNIGPLQGEQFGVLGDSYLRGSLDVDGEATFTSDFLVSGTATFTGATNVDGEATFSTDLLVSGTATFTSATNVDGEATFSTDFLVSGVTAFTSATNVMNNLGTYADDAAAGTAGLTQGTLYQTATGEVRIKL